MKYGEFFAKQDVRFTLLNPAKNLRYPNLTKRMQTVKNTSQVYLPD